MLLGAGCSTVSAPVLRHETGEALGEKHFRVLGHFEASRIFAPGAATDANVQGVAQGNSVFQGSFLGVEAEGGVLPRLDLQLGADFTLGGGGWRIGAKYELYRVNRVAIAAMAGFASGSGSSNVTYLTAATPETISLTLTAWTLDLSVPASFRLSPWIQLYGGPMMLHSGVSGSYGGAVVSDYYNDFGMNLGVRIGNGRFFGDIEAAYLLMNDPFVGGDRFVPYGGVAFGVAL
jgi:hypothetical protein